MGLAMANGPCNACTIGKSLADKRQLRKLQGTDFNNLPLAIPCNRSSAAKNPM